MHNSKGGRGRLREGGAISSSSRKWKRGFTSSSTNRSVNDRKGLKYLGKLGKMNSFSSLLLHLFVSCPSSYTERSYWSTTSSVMDRRFLPLKSSPPDYLKEKKKQHFWALLDTPLLHTRTYRESGLPPLSFGLESLLRGIATAHWGVNELFFTSRMWLRICTHK